MARAWLWQDWETSKHSDSLVTFAHHPKDTVNSSDFKANKLHGTSSFFLTIEFQAILGRSVHLLLFIIVMKRRIWKNQSENKCLERICTGVHTDQRVEGNEQSGELWAGLLEQQIKQLRYFEYHKQLLYVVEKRESIQRRWTNLRALRVLMNHWWSHACHVWKCLRSIVYTQYHQIKATS